MWLIMIPIYTKKINDSILIFFQSIILNVGNFKKGNFKIRDTERIYMGCMGWGESERSWVKVVAPAGECGRSKQTKSWQSKRIESGRQNQKKVNGPKTVGSKIKVGGRNDNFEFKLSKVQKSSSYCQHRSPNIIYSFIFRFWEHLVLL